LTDIYIKVTSKLQWAGPHQRYLWSTSCRKKMAAMKINIDLQEMAIPNRLDNYWCYLIILCIHIKTQHPDVNTEVASWTCLKYCWFIW